MVEEIKKTEAEPEKKLTIVEEAKAIRDEIKKERELLKEENDRKEKIRAEELLGSTAGGHVEPAKKEETPEEYAKKVLEGRYNDEETKGT